MGLFDKYGTRSSERAQAKKELQVKLSFVVGAILFFGVVWLLSQLGPKAYEPLEEEEWTEVSDATLGQLDAEVDGYYERFKGMAAANELSEADLVTIELAIDKQKQLIATGGNAHAGLSDSKRLEGLMQFREEVKGAVLAERVEESLEIARKARQAGDLELAKKEYERAIIFQNRINREFSSSVHRNLALARKLEIERDEVEAEPIQKEAERLLAEGLKKLEGQAFSEAVPLFEEAIRLKNRLAKDFGSTRYMNRSEMLKLEQLLVDARSGEMGLKFEGYRAEAVGLLEGGKYAEAEEAIAEAQRIYLSLKERYSGSSLVGAKTEEALEKERQTVLSAKLVEMVKRVRLELKQALQKRDMVRASELAAEYYRNARRLGDSFKLSGLIEDQWILEARFMNHVRYDIGMIQEHIYEGLLPLPGYPDKKMLGVEVTQGLYRLVTGENPSSQVAEKNPVESLTRETAEKFSRWLSWILGYEVSLPSREEFLAAVGEVKRTELEGLAWHSQNSGRVTHEVGTRAKNSVGYADLLGNAAEWTRDRQTNEKGEEEALVVGGSVRDSLLSLSRIPEELVGPLDRNRFIGFRVVVDFKAD